MSTDACQELPMTLDGGAPLVIATVPTRSIQAVTAATPADLMRYAMDSGADLDRLEKLMTIQIQWEEREAKKALNAAFAKFKAEAVSVIKNKERMSGPLEGTKYADLSSFIDAATETLSRYGLSVSWKVSKDERDWIEVTCMLKHIGGGVESVSMGGPVDNGPGRNAIQARASTVSYLERYTFKAITGLSERDDDSDGGGYDHQGGAAPNANEGLIDAGRSAALNGGLDALNGWWGALTRKQRHDLQSEYAAMRKAAQQADGGSQRG